MTYLYLLHLIEEHRPLASIIHQILSTTILLGFFQLLLIIFVCSSNSRRSVFISLPPFHVPSTFQVITCLVMLFDDFRDVCPIHIQSSFLISSPAGSWFVLLHKKLLLMVTGQHVEYLVEMTVYKYLYLLDYSCSSSQGLDVRI